MGLTSSNVILMAIQQISFISLHIFPFLIHRKAAVCPIIDVIDDNSFAYITGSDMTWGGFNWRLNFRWYSVPQRENDRRKGDRSTPLRLDGDHVV